MRTSKSARPSPAKKLSRLRVEWLEDRITPADRFWTGASLFSDNWSDSGNWAGGFVPVTGDAVIFVSSDNSLQNIPGLVLDQLRFDPGASISLSLVETLGINGGAAGPHIVNNSGFSTISGFFSPTITGLNLVNGTITVETTTASATLVVNAQISGGVGLTKSGPGTVQFQQANTFTGTTTVQDGTLSVNPPGNAVSSTVVVGDDSGGPQTAVLSIFGNDNIPDTAAVTVLGDGILNILPFSDGREAFGSLTLGSSVGGGVVQMSNGALVVGTIRANASPDGSRFLPSSTGILRLTQPLPVVVDSGVTLGTSAADLDLAILIDEASPGLGLTKSGAGILALAGGSYTGTTDVTAGTVAVNGDHSSSPFTLATGATLSGAGSTGQLTVAGGTVSPGAFFGSPHTLTTFGNVGLDGGTYSPLVSFAGGGADVLAVNGDVRLSGISLLPTAVGMGTVTAGTVFVIIDNFGPNPVVGTFAGIAEGDVITINGQPFVVSYVGVGGNGNDVTLTALDEVVISPPTLPAGTVGTPYNQTLTATGGSGPPYTFSIVTGSLPTGLTLSSSGTISGTPTAQGSFGVLIRATDSGGAEGLQSYTIDINPASTITVNPPVLPDGVVGTPYNQTVTATGGDGPYTFAVTAGQLPFGLALNSITGAITGTPTFSSIFNFTITATDNFGFTGGRPYTVTINPAGTVTVNPPTLPNGTVGVAYNQTITATGGTGPYTFNVSGSLPPGLTLNSTTGVLSGTPTTAGSSTFSVVVQDSLGTTGFRTYTLTINAASGITLSPMFLPIGTVGTAYNQTITATGGSPPFTFAVTAGSLPPGLTLSSAGVLSGTPTTEGFSNFTVTATDGFQVSGSRDYFLIVNPRPITVILTLSPPTLPNGAVGSAYSQTITATGGIEPYTFTLFDNLPPGLTLSSTGVISGTPTTTGTFNFAVIANDNHGGRGSRDYTITVTTAPVVIVLSPPALPGGEVGSAYSQAITATGGTGPFSFAVTAGALPAGLTLASDGVLSGTPTAVGQSPFTVTATDSQGNAGSRAYSISVTSVVPQALRLSAIGSGTGGGPRVQVFNPDGSIRFDFFAFEDTFYGGVRVAVGDVNGDGIDDIVTGAGFTGGPVVRVFSGADLTVLSEFFAYDPNFRVGVFVAVGDINGDGFADVITGAGSALPGMAGGPHVEAFDGATIGTLVGPDMRPQALLSFFAYAEDFIGGVRVAAGDIDGDGQAEVVTAPGPGGGPEIKVYSYAGTQAPQLRTSFAGFEAGYQAGLFVAVVPASADSPGGVFVGPDSFPDYAGTAFETLFPSFATDAQLIRPAQVFAVSLPSVDGVLVPTTAQRVPLLDISSLPNTGTRVGTTIPSGTDLGAAKLLVGSGPGGGGMVQVYSVQGQAIVLEREFAAFDFDQLADPSVSPSVYVAGGLFVLPGEEF